MLSIEDIRAKHGPSRYELDVPEWGGSVVVRRLTDEDYIALAESAPSTNDRKSTFGYFVRLLTVSLTDADGTPLFANGDEAILRESPALAIRLGTEVMRLNGMGVDDAKKNSPETTPDDSPSDSV